MHGIVIDQLREYVFRTHGAATWTQITSQANPGRRLYRPDEEYPDEEMEALVAGLTRWTGMPRDDVLEGFGTFVAPVLISLYAPLVDTSWHMFEFLEHIEETIHRAVRLDNPGAAPPNLKITRTGPDEVVVVYDSPRRMCAFATGLLLGLQPHFGEWVTIEDSTCMHKGDPICTLVVRRAES